MPNPVYNDTLIEFKSTEWMRGSLKIYDLQGRIVTQLQKDFSSGINRIPLNLSHFSNGVYILKVLSDRNITIGTSKLIKQ